MTVLEGLSDFDLINKYKSELAYAKQALSMSILPDNLSVFNDIKLAIELRIEALISGRSEVISFVGSADTIDRRISLLSEAISGGVPAEYVLYV